MQVGKKGVYLAMSVTSVVVVPKVSIALLWASLPKLPEAHILS